MDERSNGSDVSQVITPRQRELSEGFRVRRALPARRRRMVGPFIFLDQMGPARLWDGHGLDVRPHPHIGLATLTWLFEGELLHRDSLGTVQAIRPGEVNWMTAGRGIAHSERTPDRLRRDGEGLHGIQTWLALPKESEEVAPAFFHFDETQIPRLDTGGVTLRLVAGTLAGERSPVKTFSETLLADLAFEPGARFSVPSVHAERALYVACGEILAAGARYETGQLLVLRPGADVLVEAAEEARLMLLGGAPMDGPRHIWWNFVSSSKARIEQAKDDWRAGRFGQVVGETEFIPLPEEPPPAVRYP
jgi:redox-sensitive bicupin YhaK (pirin superfamily)